MSELEELKGIEGEIPKYIDADYKKAGQSLLE